MEPTHAFQRFFPINIAGSRFGDSRSGAVVNDLGRALVGPAFQIIDPQTSVGTDNAGRVHAEGAKLAKARFPNVVGRQHCQKRRVQPVVCQRHRNIRFAAAKRRLKRRTLKKAFMSRTFQPEHDLSESKIFHRSAPVISASDVRQSRQSHFSDTRLLSARRCISPCSYPARTRAFPCRRLPVP